MIVVQGKPVLCSWDQTDVALSVYVTESHNHVHKNVVNYHFSESKVFKC